MSILSRFKESKIGQFWLKYEKKIVLAVGIILIAAVSFEAGYLEGQKNKREPIVVNEAVCAPCPKNEIATDNSETGKDTLQNNPSETESQIPADNQKCAFIASKNSNKYHLASCQWAGRIKPENKICFSSAEEALKKGYQGAKCCIK